ncbi:MAG: Rieske 2Fe-2S domain-containing protein [Actinobacteria bacterium]|nr:Rieske 2Fe-2S domain-containing protein [Actinomycetota bacterium]
MAVVVLAAIVLVLLAVAAVFVNLRRRDTERAVGYLSRETVARDRSNERRGQVAPQAVSGRELERSVALERREPSRELATVGAGAPVAWSPPDPEQLGVNRRQFLNRGIVTGMLFGLSGFGAAVLAFLWPQVRGGFGSTIKVGKIADIKTQIAQNKGFYYVPEGRMWVTEYPASALSKARNTYSPSELAGMEKGLIALYQKCVHLGCRVPSCATSQWFECPCHGSQYNRVGEKKGGPAPRGLDRFAMSVDAGGNFVVNTGLIILGPPIGTNTTGQEAEGPHCISSAGGEKK